METTRYFVGVFIEFAPCVQNGHNDFQRRLLKFFVHTGRNTASIILYRNRVVRMNNNVNMGTIAGEVFINRIIHYLPYQVVQAL